MLRFLLGQHENQYASVPRAFAFKILQGYNCLSLCCAHVPVFLHPTQTQGRSLSTSFAELLDTLNRSEPALLDEVQTLILGTKGVPLSVRRDALFGVTALALAHRQQRSPSIEALVSSGNSSFLAVVLDQVVKWLLQQVLPRSTHHAVMAQDIATQVQHVLLPGIHECTASQ